MRTNWVARAGAALGVVAAVAAGGPKAEAGFTVFEAAGANPAAIQGTVDAFRAAVGALNPNNGSAFPGGRREINWDGVPDLASDPNPFPGDFFNSTTVPGRSRGASLSTPGTGFLVSANAGLSTPPLFGFPNDFQVFSSPRLFTALNSNVTDVTFFVPGTTTPATTTAFGVVFTDIEVAGLTKVEFFDRNDNLIFARDALVAGNQGLTFLGGVANAGERVGRVRITSGLNTIVSNGVLGNQIDDVVVMDDFVYAEPQVITPAPPSAVLLAVGAAGGLAARLRRRAAR